MSRDDGAPREVLPYCLPALILGLLLRAVLTARMPWGYVQYDTAEFLETPLRLFQAHVISINGKRGLFVPLLYTIPFLIHIPALILIPLGQHLLGLAATWMSALLTRHWFRAWRWFIVPVTLFMAANPSMLWYEQTLMGESEFLFSLVFLALAGTLWVIHRTRRAFWLLFAALVCAAGARPEGKLYFAFGLLLVIFTAWGEWGQWRALARRAGAIVALALAWGFIVRQSTAPQLLYASLIQLAPDHSRLLPGVEPYILPLRDQVRAESGGDPMQLVKVSKRVRDYIDPYVWSHVRGKHDYYKVLNRTLRDLCLDAVLAHPVRAAGVPIEKFRAAVDSWSAYQFSEAGLHRNQAAAYESDPWLYKVLGSGLTGSPMDHDAMTAFIASHYHPASVAWLGGMQRAWNNALIFVRSADRQMGRDRWVHDFAGGIRGGLSIMPGVPWFYVSALVGMLVAMAWPHPARLAHLAWAPVMLGVWYAATFIGVTNARYRFAYEPFCIIYVCLLVDCLLRPFGAGSTIKSSPREGAAGS